MELFIGIIVIGCGIYAIAWIVKKYQKASLYDSLKPRLDNLDRYNLELDQKRDQSNREFAESQKKLALQRESILLLAKQKAIGFPWLADAYSDFYHLEDLKVARGLETKSHPAKKAAEEVREAGQRRRTAERKARLVEYQIKYYESLFPWLSELKSEDVDDELIRVSGLTTDGDGDDDPVRHWLTPEEYRKLPNNQKCELALERYWTKKKTKWEIGRDYERYIGYLYEKDGSAVQYQGIIEGFDDLGRDLIVKNGNSTQIVQCKNWSKEKTIHEKHIFQLYGTLIAYQYDHPTEKTTASFVTSTSLSQRARGFAKLIGVEVKDGLPLVRYPCIKCHVSKKTGEKIYHLPFDQQYDKTIIEVEKGEYYVDSIGEAERRGFRRAFRYRGLKE
ncbi:MAG: hypothetical protein C4576_13380 [Desulfobacteraceae bacterium]|nr:MAG: hypothetical protein C4576_13380 [Desulfobacteraceae bacterium]